ncbi:MAG: toll/interleukin-1 receptor domain-containing protein [Candidatus Thiodiazotropha sp.]
MASVFMSYSHTDEELRDELEKHLAGLRRQGVISTWHDRRIGPGEELHGQISAQLDAANIILLLVSADFLASDYCYDVEMKRAMERHEQGNARVIPVILRPCDWHGAPFGKLMAVPTDGKPVAKHATLDDGFLEVAQAVRQAAESLGGDTTTVEPSGDLESAVTPAQLGPRSSNLGIKKEFTDRERHAYLNEAFEYLARYFENSLQEVQTRNSEVETDFKRIDANRFEARAFVRGQEQSRCGIWLGSLSRADGLYFSFDGVGNGNSYNESMSVGDDGSTLFLSPMGMAHFGRNGDKELTDEGAAEYFWSLFIERLR